MSVQDVIDALAGLPPALIYLVLAVGAALENVVPPVPADTFVLFGAFLAGTGRADAWLVFACTWAANVASAVAVYALARKYGQAAFGTGVGRWLLKPRQLRRIADFYERWGHYAIFASRFFPALRALVPLFAGVSHVSAPRLVIPVATASAIWYGALTWAGASVGRNWHAILERFNDVSNVLLAVAAVLMAALGAWWWRTRHHEPEDRADAAD